MTKVEVVTIVEPHRIETVGQDTFYCAGCGADNPIVHSALYNPHKRSNGQIEYISDIAVLVRDGLYHPAIFCADCTRRETYRKMAKTHRVVLFA